MNRLTNRTLRVFERFGRKTKTKTPDTVYRHRWTAERKYSVVQYWIPRGVHTTRTFPRILCSNCENISWQTAQVRHSRASCLCVVRTRANVIFGSVNIAPTNIVYHIRVDVRKLVHNRNQKLRTGKSAWRRVGFVLWILESTLKDSVSGVCELRALYPDSAVCADFIVCHGKLFRIVLLPLPSLAPSVRINETYELFWVFLFYHSYVAYYVFAQLLTALRMHCFLCDMFVFILLFKSLLVNNNNNTKWPTPSMAHKIKRINNYAHSAHTHEFFGQSKRRPTSVWLVPVHSPSLLQPPPNMGTRRHCVL